MITYSSPVSDLQASERLGIDTSESQHISDTRRDALRVIRISRRASSLRIACRWPRPVASSALSIKRLGVVNGLIHARKAITTWNFPKDQKWKKMTRSMDDLVGSHFVGRGAPPSRPETAPFLARTKTELLLDSSTSTMSSPNSEKGQDYPPDLSEGRLIDLISQIKVG